GLADIDAAVRALRRRSDVNDAPMLMGGQSRGGLLSIIYAARHPDQILGVINFAGGWLAESCMTAAFVNKSLFGWWARFTRRTLWLYGRNDGTFSSSTAGPILRPLGKQAAKVCFSTCPCPIRWVGIS